MADNTKLELVVEVDVNKANASIKGINTGLSSMEQAATKAARSASQGVDGMTASMIKGATAGNLLADAIKNALEFAKSWTIEAAQQAAHLDRAVTITQTLARAHGDGAAAAQQAVEAIRGVGFSAQDATTSVQKLIIADIGLEKAKGLARVAKDAAALSTEGLGAADAFEKIMLAIETGQSRGLRTMSIFTDMEKAVQVEQLKRGRTLTDLETKQVRYNAVMQAAQSIQGASAAAAGTFDGQMAALGRDVQALRDEVGQAFQGELQKFVGILRDVVGWLKQYPDVITKVAEGAAIATAVAGVWKLAGAFSGLKTALLEMTAALAANPIALMVTGIAAAGAVIYKSYRDMQAEIERKGQDALNAGIRRDLLSGKLKLDDVRKMGMTDDQIRELVSGRKALPGESFGDFNTGVKVKTDNGPDVDALKLAAEIRKRQAENEKFFAERAVAAGSAGQTGFAKDVTEVNSEIARHSTYVDDKGISHYVALTRTAWNSIIDELQKKWQAFKDHVGLENRKEIAEYLKGQDEVAQRAMEFEARRYQQRIQNDTEIATRNLDHLREVYGFEEQRAGFERDARLRALEGSDAQTIQQKVAVEQQKAQIEIDYLEKVQEVKQRLYDLDTARLLGEEELTLKRLGYQADEIRDRIAELTQQRQDIRDLNTEANDAAVQAARETAATRTAQMVRDHNREIFNSLKQQAGGVFDALLQKSQSVWSAIGNSLKTALLTAIKDVVTSRVAAMLMGMFGAGRVSFASGGSGGGVLGGIGGMLGIGATPVFSGGGAFGSGPVNGNPMILSAMGSGAQLLMGSDGLLHAATSATLSGSGMGSAPAQASGGIFSKAGLAGFFPGLKSFFGFGSDTGVDLGNGVGATGSWILQNGSMLQKLQALGKSNAALMAGGMLALDGLRRGGIAGMGEDVAGGAMIGYKFGGGVGAAIGAAAGLVAGVVRLFVKGAVDKAKDKIKALYGVDIQDKQVLQQIVDTAKSAFGGNLDMAIRSPQIRDLIQLYAMTTGQKPTGMPGTVTPVSLAETGGSLFQAPTYQNGTALPGLGGLSSLDSIGAGTPTGMVINFTMPAEAVNDAFNGRTVQVLVDNSRVVQSAALAATKSNAGRREMTALQLSPGTLTS